MTERKFPNSHYDFIESESVRFLTLMIGQNLIDEHTSLQSEVENWGKTLTETVSCIMDEFFNWYDENIDN